MDLLLGQIVYTSFPQIGLRTLKSARVPKEIQQTFIQTVVSHYWDAYNSPKSGYRAVYLHQVTSERSLFGWLYNDGLDDLGRSHVPYFICYYLAEPLCAFQIENIFTCLHKGPVALINRHSLPATLETMILPDLRSYQAARPGVVIPSSVRKRSHIALKQGELLDLFVPVDEHEMVVKLNGQTYEQQVADLSIYTRYIIEGIQTSAIESIEAAIAQQTKAIQPQELDAVTTKSKDVTPVKVQKEGVAANASDTLFSIKTLVPQFLSHRNSHLLLKLVIAATVLALFASIYKLLQTSIFVPSNPEVIQSSPSSLDIKLYSRMQDVPNVPKGLFNYGGALLFAPLRSQKVIDAITQAHPQFNLRYVDPLYGRPGSRKGVTMLINNELSFSQNALPLDDSEYSRAKARSFTLQEVPVAIDGATFFTHSGVDIAGLSVDQLQGIYTGIITNWKQVGGPDLAIVPITIDPKDSSTMAMLMQNVGGIGSIQHVVIARDFTATIRQVSATPGGIGFGSVATVKGQRTIRPLSIAKVHSTKYVSPYNSQGQINTQALRDGTYPLTRRIFVNIRRDGTPNEQAGVAYANLLLSTEGQRLIEQAGFLAIY